MDAVQDTQAELSANVTEERISDVKEMGFSFTPSAGPVSSVFLLTFELFIFPFNLKFLNALTFPFLFTYLRGLLQFWLLPM